MAINKLFTTAYTKEINEEERSIVAWGSKAIVDRDKEIIKGDAWDLKAYRKHPIILLAHGYKELWVGKALWIKPSEEGLLFKGQFATTDSAKEAFQLVKDTGIAAFSVGFIPKKWEDKMIKDMTKEEKEMVKGSGLSDEDKVRIYTRCELLEISLVSVPSCSTAVLEAYNEGKIKTKELKDKIKELIEIIDDDNEEDKDVILKPEETENYIRIPVKGEEGKHSGHRIRTITISADEGIKALYCGQCKKAITFLFDKSKGWTIEKAKKWMADHGKAILDYIRGAEEKELNNYEKDKENIDIEAAMILKATKEDIEMEEKGVIPFKAYSKAPEGEAWDAGKEVREAEVKDLKIMCTWFDSENPDIKNSYKLPHHKAKGYNVVWRAVAAAMAALLGARGGVAIPASDKRGVYNHLVGHYKQFDKEPPEFKEYTQEELDDYFQEKEQSKGFSLNEIYEIVKENKELKEKLEEIVLKAGAVLNKKNKADLKNAQQLIQNVLDSAEPAEAVEEGKDIEIEDDDIDIEISKEKEEKKENNEIDIKALTEALSNYYKTYQEEIKRRDKELYKYMGDKTYEIADMFYKKMKGKVL